jgi:hypothetical protein
MSSSTLTKDVQALQTRNFFIFSEMTCLDPNPDSNSDLLTQLNPDAEHYSKVRYLSLVSTSSSLLL